MILPSDIGRIHGRSIAVAHRVRERYTMRGLTNTITDPALHHVERAAKNRVVVTTVIEVDAALVNDIGVSAAALAAAEWVRTIVPSRYYGVIGTPTGVAVVS